MNVPKKIKPFLIPSIADVIFMSVFLFISFASGKGLLADCDTGYHIRAGEFMLDNHVFLRKDIFSFITPPLPWTAHEWLSEIIMAVIHRLTGLTGIVIFFAVLIASVYYFLFKMVRSYNSNIILTALIVALSIGSSQIHWLARPHIFSLALIVLWYYLLDLYQYRDRNYLYLLPLLMLLWVNLHAGFISGFMLLLIYIGGNLISFIFTRPEGRQITGKKLRNLTFIFIACIFMAFVNPFGYHILTFPFNLTSNKYIMDNISEFISPNFHEPMPFKYLLILMIAILAIARRRLNAIETMLILLFTYMSLYSARYIPLFAVITAPILVRQSGMIMSETNGRFIEFFRKRSYRIALTDSFAKGYLLPSLSVLLVVILSMVGRLSYTFDRAIKPVDAIQFLKNEPLTGNMFNNDEFGDYIIYAAWPQYRVFFDGRSDMYGTAIMKEYFKIAGIKQGWEDVIRKYNIDWIIYNSDSALSQLLADRRDWQLIYSDKVASIFIRNIPQNRNLIEKYKSVKLFVIKDENDSLAKK